MAAGDLKTWKTYVSRWARIQEACIALADADSDDDVAYRRAEVRLRKTLIECGWRPPGKKSKRGETIARFQLSLWRETQGNVRARVSHG